MRELGQIIRTVNIVVIISGLYHVVEVLLQPIAIVKFEAIPKTCLIIH